MAAISGTVKPLLENEHETILVVSSQHHGGGGATHGHISGFCTNELPSRDLVGSQYQEMRSRTAWVERLGKRIPDGGLKPAVRAYFVRH